MQKLIVQGGAPLKGRVQISGAKNAAIKAIASSLLTDGEVVLENVPHILDVDVDLDIVKHLGVEVERDANLLKLKHSDSENFNIPPYLASRSRAAIITMGPLLARFGRVSLPMPGGCPIGKRPLDRHLFALKKLGASFDEVGGVIHGCAKRLKGGTITFSKNTVMGTENAILAAVLASGDTEIRGAAREPEVDDLIKLLNSMGAKIKRDGKDLSLVRISGVNSLSGARHKILPDRNEAVTFAIAAAVTCGDVVLENVDLLNLTAFLRKLKEVGVEFSGEDNSLRVWVRGGKFLPADIKTGPHPSFMTDWQQPFLLLLTLADGVSLVHETVYENRWDYTKELKKMGAEISLHTPFEVGKRFDPENYGFDWGLDTQPKVFAKVVGPCLLQGSELNITDLRAGATLVLAALAAKGESTIYGVEHIERGYENFVTKLQGLGGRLFLSS